MTGTEKDMLSGDVETQPNINEEEERQFWADHEMDSKEKLTLTTHSLSGYLRASEFLPLLMKRSVARTNWTSKISDRISNKSCRSKRRKKLRRMYNTVTSKPRILKRKIDKGDTTSGFHFNKERSEIKPPDWRFSNLPIAKKYRPTSDSSSSDSNEDVRVVRMDDWKQRREHKKRRYNTFSSSENSTSETDDLCVSCVSRTQDTILVHETKGHLCCCFQCARVLQDQGYPCPVCNLEITRIINL